jgi:hypothetical protein
MYARVQASYQNVLVPLQPKAQVPIPATRAS